MLQVIREQIGAATILASAPAKLRNCLSGLFTYHLIQIKVNPRKLSFSKQLEYQKQ